MTGRFWIALVIAVSLASAAVSYVRVEWAIAQLQCAPIADPALPLLRVSR